MFHPNRCDVLITLGALAAGAAIGEQAPLLHEMAASTTSQPRTTQPRTEGNCMSTIATKDGTEIFYKDGGPKDAQPIVFHHGWPLSSDDWDVEMLFFLGNGYRVVAHDRRGHGRSSQVATGHDMDHYASDAAAVVEHLDLRNAIHIGHSTGGGEVARYVAKYGEPQGRVAKAVLIAAIPSLMLKTEKNPGSTPIEVFDGFRKRWPRTIHSSFSMFLLVRFTASIDPARRPRRESSRIGGVRGWWAARSLTTKASRLFRRQTKRTI
jgi:non-heme chloroperoxidase